MIKLKDRSVAALIEGCEIRRIKLEVDREKGRLKVVRTGLLGHGDYVEELRRREGEVLEAMGFTFPPAESELQRFEDVPEEEVEWLWPGRIAVGKLTLVVGEPGVGKSFLAANLAARTSGGMGWPGDESGEAGNVFFLKGDDGLADTMRPRLRRAGADLKRVYVVNAIKQHELKGDVVREVDLAKDLETIERGIVQAGGCRLLIIDPVSKFFKTRRSRHDPAVEETLRGLLALAEKHRFAVVAFSDKERTKTFKAFAAAARAVFAICRDVEQPRLRLLVPLKQNLSGEEGVMSYYFEGSKEETAVMLWDTSPDTRGADEVLAEGRYRRAIVARRREVESFLMRELEYGERKSAEILERAHELGLPTKTVRYVYRMAGGEAVKKGMKGGWVWNWPRGWKRFNPANPDFNSLEAKGAGEGELGAKEAGFCEDGEIDARVDGKGDGDTVPSGSAEGEGSWEPRKRPMERMEEGEKG